MNTKNILKTLALAMLLATACNKNEIANDENTEKKGFALPVTVNVTREGDDATKATYNEGTGKLSFSTGDKLFVSGSAVAAGSFAGTLTWQSGGTFSGTIYTESPYEGTIDDLLNGNYATLLPAGYESYDYLEIIDEGYDALLGGNAYNSFATSKKLAVEQLSFEHGEYTSGTGFVLMPQNAILNFTITGLTASTNVTATLSDDDDWTPDIEGEVTTDGSGNATFAIGLEGSSDLNEFTLSVAGNAITLVSSSKVLAAGKIYNVTRCVNAINGLFSVSSTKKVFFSKGNLQATTTDLGATWTWAFAANQWSRVGDAAANTSMKTDGTGTVTANGTVDLFGWVGASSSWTTAAKWGISSSTTSADYGNVADEALKSDWGNVPGIGTGWRTLTGGDTDSGEWDYLFNSRSASTVNGTANARYAKATVNSVAGVVLFPDSYTHPAGVTAPASINTGNINYAANSWSGEDWTKMEKAGCVFLPAGGYRNSTTMSNVGTGGYYWTSTSTGSSVYRVFYLSNKVTTSGSNYYRNYGYSVRLVHDAN